MSRFSRAIASSRSSSLIRYWSAVSLVALSVALSSPCSDSVIHELKDLGTTSNFWPAATLKCCSVTSLMASLLNS